MIAAIEAAMHHDIAGDPITGIRWTRRTTEKISQQLATLDIQVCPRTVARILKDLDYRLRVNHKRVAAGSGPDRDQQFTYIAQQRMKFAERDLPIVSIDSKKRELVGNFKNSGSSWDRAPQLVLDHDFRSQADGIAIPYGVYDTRANCGAVFVGTSHDTADFAVDNVLRWWLSDGSERYPGAHELLVLADSGGSNAPRIRRFKYALQTRLVEDDMDLLVRVLGDQLVHELEKLPPSPTVEVAGLHHAGGYRQGSEKRGRAVAAILMAEPAEGFAVGKLQPALGPLKGLNMGLLVHADHYPILRRLQIQPDDIGCLAGELGISPDTPALSALKTDAVLAQHAPHVVMRDIAECLSQQPPVPLSKPCRWRLIKLLQDTLLGVLVVAWRSARTRRIGQSGHAVARKARPPLAHGRRAHLFVGGDLGGAVSFGGRQYHACSKRHVARLMRFPGYSQTRQKAEDRFAWVGFRAMTGVRSPYVYPVLTATRSPRRERTEPRV